MLHGFGGIGFGELEVIVGEGLISEGTSHETWELAMVAVVEDGEILTVRFHVVHEASSSQGTGGISHVI